MATWAVPLLPIFLAARVRLKSAPLWSAFAGLGGLDLTRTRAV